RSATRQQLVPHIQPRYAGYVCWRAVVDSTGLMQDESSETYGPKGRFGLVPLANNQLYWFACTNAPKNDTRYPAYTIEDIRKHFAGYRDPIGEVLERTQNDRLIYGEIADLPPLKRFAFGNILLIGDAAHATTPNMGQGACQAIEDAVLLAGELAKNTNVSAAFVNFENRRLERTRFVTLQSRRIGQVAQWQNPVLGVIRDFLMANMPESARTKQFDKLFSVEF
ncbi:MAG TPA: FAD-dependent monooxygenase, partial [Bacteroidia bacterium]|nr:FAD-dependent monooxygenase [Bacteroidia bacterium]